MLLPDPLQAVVLVAAGLSAGFVTGLVGMGGAILLVPILAYGVGVPYKLATGISALHGLVAAVMAYLVHGRYGSVETRLGLAAGAASVAGALSGAALSGVADPTGVKLVYVAAVLLALALMVVRAEAPPGSADAAVTLRLARAAAIGSLAGLVAGVIGAGGAFVLVPLFRFSLRLPIHRAIGTSMLVAIFTALSALAGKGALGQVPWLTAAFVVTGSAIGTRLGVRLTHRIPARPLRRLLIGLLVLLLLRTLVDVVR